MRKLLACTCLTPVLLLSTNTALRAETVIDTKRTTPILTSTAKGTAADDIRITANGSIVPTSGTAVTIDSNNSLKNDGTIQITNSNNAVGIHANAGVSGTITNTGKIIIDETYAPADADKDGDNDGPLAQGSGRFGIRTGGAFTGNIVNSGSISVEGNDSGGIFLGGPLGGTLDSSGTINVVGDRSFGIKTSDITGNVKLTGAISAQGAGAVGVSIDGNIGGAMVVQGAIGSTGYRSTTSPADPSKLDADDLLQGGPALKVAGNVAGGIIFDAPPKDNDPKVPDEDKDGVEDAKEGAAAVTSYGSAAAVRIGAADKAINVGPVAGSANGHGLIVNGGIAGNGVYKGVDARGVEIGGLGGAVTIAGGMTVNGTVSAASAGADATALRIGAGASVHEIRSGGVIAAAGGSTAATQTQAIVIDAGADVRTLRNSGRITATTAGDGSAAAIVDKAGTLTLIENSGTISASGAPAGSDRGAALDLRANTTGVTVRQLAVAQGVNAPAVTGNILFGSGNDALDLADGTVSGTTRFGAGANRLSLSGDAAYAGNVEFGAGNDVVALAGTSALKGNVDFGGGNDSLTLSGTSHFNGELIRANGLAVALQGGRLDLTNKGIVNLASLSMSGGSSITVTIDPKAETFTQYQIAGAAVFAADSKVNVRLSSISEAEGDYVILRAGTLTGGANLTASTVAVPFLYNSSLAANAGTGQVSLNIKRKTTGELGLNGSETRAFESIYDALGQDEDVEDVFLGIGDKDQFRSTMAQMLPDHAGGTFEAVTQGSRATARFLADPNAPFSDQGGWGFWLQQVAWGTSKGIGDTASYDITGWGASAGAELETKSTGNLGLSLAYLAGRNANGGNDNEVDTRQYELAGYWRGNWGGFHADARISAAHINFGGVRHFTGSVDGEAITKTSRADWGGQLYSASAGASYELRFGRISLRPTAAVDYYKLKENGFSEAGGGDAIDLIVDSRDSDELAATGSIAAALNFGGKERDASWFRVELEGGRRQILSGELGATTAHFKDGEDFTLTPEDRTNGWVGKLRMVGGTSDFKLGGEFNAEEQQGRTALAFRVSLNTGF